MSQKLDFYNTNRDLLMQKLTFSRKCEVMLSGMLIFTILFACPFHKNVVKTVIFGNSIC
jgi:hypothetical protein